MPKPTDDPGAVIRACVERLSDDTVRGVVEGMVRGIVRGIAEEVADRATDVIMRQLADLGAEEDAGGEVEDLVTEPVISTPVVAAPAPSPESVVVPPPGVKRCELCGREGTRRFEETYTGWRCSPTARCGDRPAQQKVNARKPASVSVIAPKQFQPKVTPPRDLSTLGVTARCQDCTRACNLTGGQLESVVAAHERTNGHIVDILGEDI